MPTWLSDPPRSLYIVLALAGILPLLAAAFLVGTGPTPRRDPKKKESSARRPLIIIGVMGLLALLGLFLCDRLIESDREQITRKLKEMSEGVDERNLDKTFAHISESFQYSTATKANLRARGDEALRTEQVTSIPIWGIEVQPIAPGAGEAKVIFRFKVRGGSFRENQFLGEAIFIREPENQWRLKGFTVFPPTGLKDPFSVPGL